VKVVPLDVLPVRQAGRVETDDRGDVSAGRVVFSPRNAAWLAAMSAGAAWAAAFELSLGGVALFALSTAFVLLFGHSLGSHRKLVHDAFDCPRWLERGLVYSGVLVGLAGPIGLLRQHELRDHAQRRPDCHRYLRHGSGWLRDAYWQLACELRLDDPPAIKLERRITSDPFYAWLERTWRWQQAPVALVLFACGGFAWVLWGVCARVTAGVVGHWIVGYLAHNHGEMRYRVPDAAVQGRNVRLVSLLTMGECWHNNHHAYPDSARLGLEPGQWDPGWWVLLALKRAGLVTRIALPHAH
jgi:fatty-acid desaturase